MPVNLTGRRTLKDVLKSDRPRIEGKFTAILEDACGRVCPTTCGHTHRTYESAEACGDRTYGSSPRDAAWSIQAVA